MFCVGGGRPGRKKRFISGHMAYAKYMSTRLFLLTSDPHQRLLEIDVNFDGDGKDKCCRDGK